MKQDDLLMDIQQARELLKRYQEGSCTPSEKELVEKWYSELVETGEWQWGKGGKEMMQKAIETRIMKQLDESHERKVVYLAPRFRWWAAASVILLLGAFGYFILFHKSTQIIPQIAKAAVQTIKAPQSNKATVTLANGQQVFLDSVGNGALAMQGNVQLVKLANGKIAYQQGAGEPNARMEYNTLTNPRGSKVINMTLADGSKVWLNAASSLTYPVSFAGNERKVAITGEAYFEVAHDASKPFIVTNGSMDVRVLGTHFNVNTFKDDGNMKVTLLEGSVKITNKNASGVIKPGQQAIVTNEIKVVNDVDLDLVMAWKNGYFQFDNASLPSVLSEISRWYDVDVIYEGHNKPRQFAGAMQRDLTLNEVLRILQKNNVHFKIDGKQLRVMPD